MTAKRALEKIYALPRFNRGETLEPVRRLLSALHNPQNVCPYIHVAGTNGKGSISTMIATVLEKAGYRVGLYTSPYINDFRERFQINGKPVRADLFADATRRVFLALRKLSCANEIAQFDVVTAIAFILFAEADCDIVVLECGLGGRLDATNIIEPPKVAVIGNIGYDHTDLLGQTIPAITAEKCGIIKPGTGTLICAPQDYPEAGAVCESVAAVAGVPHIGVQNEDCCITSCSMGSLYFTYKGVPYRTSLAATYQAKNAGAAIETVFALRELGMEIPDKALTEGLATAFIPARLELFSLYPHVLLDGAHNKDGMTALRDSIESIAGRIERLHCIVGILQDKNPTETLQAFFNSPTVQEKLATVVTVTPPSPRACTAENLRMLLQDMVHVPVVACEPLEEAPDRVISCAMQGDDLLLCFGSLYMMGDIRRALKARFLKKRRRRT